MLPFLSFYISQVLCLLSICVSTVITFHSLSLFASLSKSTKTPQKDCSVISELDFQEKKKTMIHDEAIDMQEGNGG